MKLSKIPRGVKIFGQQMVLKKRQKYLPESA